jgi:four helix bundle protein
MAYDNGSPFGFEDLEVNKEARKFRTRIYKLAKLLPPEEKFQLRPQMTDAAISLTNNIAEGHGRFNWQDNTKFCRNSRGSLCELVDDITACMDEGYAKEEHLLDLKGHAVRVLKLLNGYIAYLQKKKCGEGAP